MSTKIEWTDETWNPVTGCTKISLGCKHCYAKRLWPKIDAARVAREGGEPREFEDVRCHPERLLKPINWGKGKMVFVNSVSDLFHEDVPFQFIADVFAVMSCTTRHRYQVLTKRADRMLEFFRWLDYDDPDIFLGWPAQIDPLKVFREWKPTHGGRGYDNCGPAWPLENVWLGVSVENQEEADKRIPLLLQAPAAVRWISAEPLLGPIDLTNVKVNKGINDSPEQIDVLAGQVITEMGFVYEGQKRLDWVVVGGESGPDARPMHPDWARSLRDQCAARGVPFFFKQWGEHYSGHEQACFVSERAEVKQFPDGTIAWPIGKKAAGRTLDGRTHDEYPA